MSCLYRREEIFPLNYFLSVAGPEETKNQRGKSPPPDSDPFNEGEFRKTLSASSSNKHDFVKTSAFNQLASRND